MQDGQFKPGNVNMPGVKRLWFKWTMTAADAFTINWSKEFLAGTAGIVRTGTGVYDLFPQSPPGVALVGWWFDCILATANDVTKGGSGKTTVANNLSASSKVTATFRRNDTLAAADLANTDIVYGYLDIQTVYLP